MRRWVIDGNNVMGAGGDGWWNDPVAAAARTAQAVAAWCRVLDDHAVTLVFDGRPDPRLAEAAGGNLTVEFATRAGRDAADDRIVTLVDELGADQQASLIVVTSDRGLVARLPAGTVVEGAGRFRDRVGLARRGRGHRQN